MVKSSPKCEQILGRGPSGPDDIQYYDHLAECDYCRATSHLLSFAADEEDRDGALPPLDDLSARKLADSVLAKHQTDRSRRRHDVTRKKLVPLISMSAATLFVIAVGGWFFFPAGNNDLEEMFNKTETPDYPFFVKGSSFELLSGEVFMGARPANADGQVVSGSVIKTLDGRAVVALPVGIAVSMSKDTNLSVQATSEGNLKVDMSSGSALFALDPAQKRFFSVETNIGRIDVTGTVFTVESLNGSVKVHLHRGSLTVTEKDGRVRKLRGEQSLTLGSVELEPVPSRVAVQMRTLAQELMNLGIGGHLSAFLAPQEPVATLEDLPDSKTEESQKNSPSLRALMSTARAHKLDGNWYAAAATYEQIISRFKKSDDAATSRVSLGQLNLDKLKRPAKALRYFNAYLKFNSNGPLAPEALYGRAKSLRSLGKQSAELEALEQLLVSYPNGTHAGIAKKRINELKP